VGRNGQRNFYIRERRQRRWRRQSQFFGEQGSLTADLASLAPLFKLPRDDDRFAKGGLGWRGLGIGVAEKSGLKNGEGRRGKKPKDAKDFRNKMRMYEPSRFDNGQRRAETARGDYTRKYFIPSDALNSLPTRHSPGNPDRSSKIPTSRISTKDARI
jgi:hypothetical protein